MTWAKFGAHFFDDLVNFDFPEDLDDACQLTHTQAVHFVYSTESYDCSFPKKKLARFATSARAQEAGNALVAAGVWEVVGTRVRLLHHREEIRQSLAAQNAKRERDRVNAAKKRERTHKVLESVETAQTQNPSKVANDVADESAATHSFIHSSSHSNEDKAQEGVGTVRTSPSSWPCPEPDCSVVLTERTASRHDCRSWRESA
ncbi:hypothetical protein [Dietzia papillomatosis]|uniref:hypothetical protein n=1 Tax=Dietzia papillomatosis TaxID=282305 RepID=UPI00078509D7|nr:hypothetical protein [Dietzia papillomatosis]